MTGCRSAIVPSQLPVPTRNAAPTQPATLAQATPPPATPTAEPPTPEPTATSTFEPLSGQVWTAENAASAQSTELLLPDYPAGIYWPGNTRVLVYLNNSFLEIYLDPLMTGVTNRCGRPRKCPGDCPGWFGIDLPGRGRGAAPLGPRHPVQYRDPFWRRGVFCIIQSGRAIPLPLARSIAGR